MTATALDGTRLPPRETGLKFWLQGYFQHLVGFAGLLGFNLLLPALVGLDVFGAFTTTQGLMFLVTGLFGGGLDFVLLREGPQGPGVLGKITVRRIVVVRGLLLVVASLGILAASHRILPPSPEYQGLGAWLAIFAVGLGFSSLLMAAYAAGRRNDMAIGLSAAHSAVYIALPLATCLIFGSSPRTLLAGVAASYLFIVGSEAVWLRKLRWTREPRADGYAAIAGKAVAFGFLPFFDVVRFWITFYLGAFFMSTHAVGVSKVAFSTGIAFASLVPVPQHSLVVLGSEWDANQALGARILNFVRPLATLGGVGAAVLCYALSVLLYPAEQRLFQEAALAVLFLPFAVATSRFAISVRLASVAPRRMTLILAMAAVLTSASALALPSLLGVGGIILAPVVGSVASVLILDNALLRQMVGLAEAITFGVAALIMAMLLATDVSNSLGIGIAALSAVALTYATFYMRRHASLRAQVRLLRDRLLGGALFATVDSDAPLAFGNSRPELTITGHGENRVSRAQTGRPNADLYREIAEKYPSSARPHYAGDARRLAAIAQRLYIPGGRLVDLGSGLSPLALGLQHCGMQTAVVDRFDYPVDLVKVDRPADVLGLMTSAGVDVITFDFQSGSQLPFADETVDRVSCIAVLEHFHHSPKALFAEIFRILRTGGRLIVGCPNAVNLRKRVSVAFGRSNHPAIAVFWRDGDPQWFGHVREPTLGELRWMVQQAGLRVIDSFGLNDIAIQNYGWVGRVADPILRLTPNLCSDIYVVAEK